MYKPSYRVKKGERVAGDQPVNRGEAITFWKSACMASEMPSVGLTSKYRPGDAHVCMFVAIWLGRV